jgi:hypothetical protein
MKQCVYAFAEPEEGTPIVTPNETKLTGPPPPAFAS